MLLSKKKKIVPPKANLVGVHIWDKHQVKTNIQFIKKIIITGSKHTEMVTVFGKQNHG